MREALTDKRAYTTCIYPLPLDSGGIKICAVSNFINTGNVFGGGVIWFFFFYMKRDQREKRYFYKICRFFFKFLKLIFDRICIPPPNKDRGI